MIEATSCGGVVIFRGKILLLYKNYKNKYEGWVLPKGTVEEGEEFQQTALREVLEESGSRASIIKYVGKSEYTFNVPEDVVEKEVHWYLMMAFGLQVQTAGNQSRQTCFGQCCPDTHHTLFHRL